MLTHRLSLNEKEIFSIQKIIKFLCIYSEAVIIHSEKKNTIFRRRRYAAN